LAGQAVIVSAIYGSIVIAISTVSYLLKINFSSLITTVCSLVFFSFTLAEI